MYISPKGNVPSTLVHRGNTRRPGYLQPFPPHRHHQAPGGNLTDADEANAHGISAVPEMVHALEEFIARTPLHVPTSLCALNCDNPIQWGEDYALRVLACQALAKARGDKEFQQ